MTKLLGAVLVLLGSGAFAAVQEREGAAELERVRRWSLALREMARRLEQCAAEMEELLRCGSVYVPSLGSVDLKRLEQQDFNSLWKTLLQGENVLISAQLEPLGTVLGRYCQEEQRIALVGAAERMEALARRLGEKQAQERRLRYTLWLSGGGALVVLLL